MKVLALGLGRTGTVCKYYWLIRPRFELIWDLALRVALERLGFQKTYHMIAASVENPTDCLMWQDALAAKYDGKGVFGKQQWDSLLGHCQAVCDWPAAGFAKELIEAYPEAKVILTTRDADSWYISVLKSVHWRAHDDELRLLARFDWASSLYQPMLRTFWDRYFHSDFEKHGKDVFLRHNQEIRKLVHPDNLLEYHISEGWNPLCKFLDLAIPDESFPHLNDSAGFVDRCRKRNRRQWMNVVLHKFYLLSLSMGILYMLYMLVTVRF